MRSDASQRAISTVEALGNIEDARAELRCAARLADEAHATAMHERLMAAMAACDAAYAAGEEVIGLRGR